MKAQTHRDRYVLFARSDCSQGQEALDQQVERLRSYAKTHRLSPTHVVQIEGRTTSTSLIALLKQQELLNRQTVLLITGYDQLARNIIEGFVTMQALLAAGVQVLAVDDEILAIKGTAGPSTHN